MKEHVSVLKYLCDVPFVSCGLSFLKTLESLAKLLSESRHVEDISGGELLLELVELVSADSVEIVAVQLLLQVLALSVVFHVDRHALEVVSYEAVVSGVVQVNVVRVHLVEILALRTRVHWVPHVLAEIVRHCSFLSLT